MDEVGQKRQRGQEESSLKLQRPTSWTEWMPIFGAGAQSSEASAQRQVQRFYIALPSKRLYTHAQIGATARGMEHINKGERESVCASEEACTLDARASGAHRVISPYLNKIIFIAVEAC